MVHPHANGVLQARPQFPGNGAALPPGMHRLDVPARRADSYLYVPPSRRRDQAFPLLLLLHGAGGFGEGMLAIFRPQADLTGTLVLAPTADGVSWDIIGGAYGPDVAHIDAALRQSFASFTVDPGHLAVGGFSDGASYALSLGVTNGDLFTHVMAFSPGFLLPTRHPDSPRLFIAHGINDRVLPIQGCRRRLVPRLESKGYELSYHEFDGGHEMPPEMLARAFAWFLA